MSTRLSDRCALPSQERLKHLFDYDEDRGLLIWKNPSGRRAKKGDVAGAVNPVTGRRAAGVDGKHLYHYRLVYAWHYGDPGEHLIDHIDRDHTNDRIENLRLATHSQNKLNCRLLKNNRSGHKGVSWDSQRQKWFAKIEVNRKQIALGRYDRLEDAVAARKKAETQYFGEFAA
jgi:hypothetical protein